MKFTDAQLEALQDLALQVSDAIEEARGTISDTEDTLENLIEEVRELLDDAD